MNTRLCTSVAMAMLSLSSIAVIPHAAACGLNLVKSANGQWTLAPPAKMSASVAQRMFRAPAPAAGRKPLRTPCSSWSPSRVCTRSP